MVMNDPKAQLRDDGTLDTVIQVAEQTYRYNFDPESGETYDEFIEWAMCDAEEQYALENTI